jgi:hypothetical protein
MLTGIVNIYEDNIKLSQVSTIIVPRVDENITLNDTEYKVIKVIHNYFHHDVLFVVRIDVERVNIYEDTVIL